jgi:hypothetical protein
MKGVINAQVKEDDARHSISKIVKEKMAGVAFRSITTSLCAMYKYFRLSSGISVSLAIVNIN